MITTQEIEHLAKLARIEVLPDEAEKMTTEIDSILEYVGKIQSVTDTGTGGQLFVRNVMREDAPTNTPGEYTDKLLDNAPSREGNYLKVKKIL